MGNNAAVYHFATTPDISGKVLLIDSDGRQADWLDKFLDAYTLSAVLERERLAVGARTNGKARWRWNIGL